MKDECVEWMKEDCVEWMKTLLSGRRCFGVDDFDENTKAFAIESLPYGPKRSEVDSNVFIRQKSPYR